MGTRGAFGFRINGKDKVTYNHFDSYPSSLGVAMLKSLQNETTTHLADIALGIKLVDEQNKPTTEQKAECANYTNLGVSRQSEDDWYCLLRDAQGSIDPWVNGLPYMINSSGFLADSLFCEFAYIINLDDNLLEFYSGFNKNPGAEGRYAALKNDDSNYYGVALIDSIPLEDIFKWTPVDIENQIGEWEES